MYRSQSHGPTFYLQEDIVSRKTAETLILKQWRKCLNIAFGEINLDSSFLGVLQLDPEKITGKNVK